jgi:hypothetical protein
VLSWTFVCAPIAVGTRLTLYWYLRRIAGPGVTLLYNLCNAVMYCILAGAMITVSASAVRLPSASRADEVVPGGPALRPPGAGGRRGRGDPRHPGLPAARAVCGRLLAVDVPDVRGRGDRHAAPARGGPARREDRQLLRPLDDRQPDDLEGRLRARLRRAGVLARRGVRVDLQPRDARGPLGHGDLPLREEVELRALLRLRHVPRTLPHLGVRGGDGRGGDLRRAEAAYPARLGGRGEPGPRRLRRPRGRDRGVDHREPHPLPGGSRLQVVTPNWPRWP